MDSPWPCRQMRTQPRLPFPGQRGPAHAFPKNRATSSPDFGATTPPGLEDISAGEAMEHLTSIVRFCPDLLEEYVVQNVRSENISRWLTKRRAFDIEFANSRYKTTSDRNVSAAVTREETKTVHKIDSGDFLYPLYTLSSILCKITQSSGFNLYGVGGIGKTLVMYNPRVPMWDPSQGGQRSFLISKETTVSGHVAVTKESVCVDDVHMDQRFPKRIGADDSSVNGIAVLCAPILLPNEDLIGVVEFYRSWHDACYTADDLQTVETILHWVSIAIHKSAQCASLHQQTEMNNFLLDVSRTYLDDITDIDNIIEHSMRFAKTLVAADRCSLFLYDRQKEELYSDLFDMGREENGRAVFERKNEIRFAVSKGIAGHVASMKTVVNIPDAYADSRFNRDVDKVTGYTTNSILCFPIMIESEVYGVVEMINKKGGGCFTKLDEENFTVFEIFCALALRYSKVHAKLENENNRHEIVLEQFKHTMACIENEAIVLSKDIIEGRLPELPLDFDRFQFSITPYNSELPAFCVQMVTELCQSQYQLSPHALARFILTVKRNYRDLPYHNWKHAVTVAHTMYCSIKRHPDVFCNLEALALVIACLAHDVDHRGLSNQYLQKIEHPLAALYTTSTMERHHYGILRMILSLEGHEVLSGLDSQSQDIAMDVMKNAILATDLASFFNNHRVLTDLLETGKFNLSNHEHRKTFIGVLMTACDLSSTAKTWEITKATVYDLYHEFWAEGDLRKKHGLTVVPMLDSDLQDQVSEGQVGFYTNVSIRCYETLAQILPECGELFTLSNENLAMWRNEADAMRERREKNEEEHAELDRTHDPIRVNAGELGIMLRDRMWNVEQSRLENEKN